MGIVDKSVVRDGTVWVWVPDVSMSIGGFHTSEINYDEFTTDSSIEFPVISLN